MRRAGAAFAALALAACAETPAPAAPPPAFEGAVWRLDSLGGAAAPGEGAWLYAEGDAVRGQGFCGRYEGALERRDGAIRIGPVASTRLRCDPALAEADAAFLGGLTDAAGFALEGNRLILLDAAGAPLMRFVR